MATAAALARQGVELRSQGCYTEAGRLFRKAIAIAPDHLPAALGLAKSLCLKGKPAAAVRLLGKLEKTHPRSVPMLGLMGDIHFDLGQYRQALACYEEVLIAHPGHLNGLRSLARCLSRAPLLALRLRSPRRLLGCLACRKIDAEPLNEAVAVLLSRSRSLYNNPLLLQLLRQALLTSLPLEHLLARKRREFCLKPPRQTPEVARAMAAQCRLNEFAWPVSQEEEARLATAPGWVRAMYGPEGVAPELIRRGRRLPTLTPISGGTSAEVQSLYEANPYPLWRHLFNARRMDLNEYLRQLVGDKWSPSGFLRRPRLLSAGCGTGREMLSAACAWRPAAVTAFDLSRTSLAYAERMAERFGIEADLYHADLMRLRGWRRRFDVIICTGVLHHLDDPLAGWRKLLTLLRPGGVMLIGLYSETARRRIVAAQKLVRELNCPPTPSGIRSARATIGRLSPKDPAFGCTVLRDFYFTSGCRDMLFHVKEHRFTIPRLAAALDELGLDFLAFDTDPAVQRRYRSLFGSRMSLNNWEKLEKKHPETFLGMYQFWCRKPN